MSEHNGGQSPRPQIGNHKQGADNRRDHQGVQTEDSVDQAESSGGDQHDCKGTPSIALEKSVHITAKNQFFEDSHQPQAEGQV